MPSVQSPSVPNASVARHRVLRLLHILVVLASVVLLYGVTYDTLHTESFAVHERYLRMQFWICVFFILETVVEWLLRPNRVRHFFTMLALVAVCVPYINIVNYMEWHVSLEVYYILRVIPIVRAAVVLVVMWGIMEKNWVTGMFGSYLIILTITLYVLSLLFYVEEHAVNAQVYNYWQSLWYSFMQMNTCGSNISPVTPAGKIIGVVLSVEGLILFPVFTVFFTQAFGVTRQDSATASSN